MALKKSQYYSIMREYEKRQLKNHDIQTAHYNEVCEKLPEFKALDDSIAILSVQYGKKLLNGDDQAVASLKKEETACVCRISRRLSRSGIYLQGLQGYRLYRQ